MAKAKKVTVFTATARHPPGDGPPLNIRSDTPGYHGYFENRYGEQWVVVFDKQTGDGRLWGGDCGWENQFEVRATPDGEVEYGDLVLGDEEKAWLRNCGRAAIGWRPATSP